MRGCKNSEVIVCNVSPPSASSLLHLTPCPELLQREQAEMAQQLANLQTDVRMSYGNDALMPDQELGDGQTDLLPQEDTVGLGGVGFIHPESFNQPNTENQGACQSTCTLVPLNSIEIIHKII